MADNTLKIWFIIALIVLGATLITAAFLVTNLYSDSLTKGKEIVRLSGEITSLNDKLANLSAQILTKESQIATLQNKSRLLIDLIISAGVKSNVLVGVGQDFLARNNVTANYAQLQPSSGHLYQFTQEARFKFPQEVENVASLKRICPAAAYEDKNAKQTILQFRSKGASPAQAPDISVAIDDETFDVVCAWKYAYKGRGEIPVLVSIWE